MAEMNAVSRFFVNRVKGRANKRLYKWLTAHLPLPAGATCLEIGCGNGNMAARIMDGMSPASYVATDLDPRQLDAAKRYLAERYPAGLPDGLELRTADMLHLLFTDGSFDAVFAFAAIHHASPTHGDFTNVPRALTEIDRVLQPEGILAYEEFLHKDKIRLWLRDHRYRVIASDKRWTREVVVARKPSAPSERATQILP